MYLHTYLHTHTCIHSIPPLPFGAFSTLCLEGRQACRVATLSNTHSHRYMLITLSFIGTHTHTLRHRQGNQLDLVEPNSTHTIHTLKLCTKRHWWHNTGTQAATAAEAEPEAEVAAAAALEPNLISTWLPCRPFGRYYNILVLRCLMRLAPLLKLLTLLLSLTHTHIHSHSNSLLCSKTLLTRKQRQRQWQRKTERGRVRGCSNYKVLYMYVCVCVYSYVWVSGSGNPQKAQAGALLSNCICAPLSHSLSLTRTHANFLLSSHTYKHTIIKLLGAFVRLSIELPSCMSFHIHIHMLPCVNVYVCGPLEASLKATKCACSSSSSNDVGSNSRSHQYKHTHMQ